MTKPYQFTSVTQWNRAVEEAAQIADAEAERLDQLAADICAQHAISPRRGLKWREEEYKAGARAARRIAIKIRQALVKSEEEQ